MDVSYPAARLFRHYDNCTDLLAYRFFCFISVTIAGNAENTGTENAGSMWTRIWETGKYGTRK